MRLKYLDLIKWVALITMVIDHLRFLNPSASQLDFWCYSIGRIAYPLFLFLMAHYFYRTREQKKYAREGFVAPRFERQSYPN